MKEIHLAYSDLYNAGDLMNVDIVEHLACCHVVRSKTYSAEMTAIGGALIGLQYSEKSLERIAQHILRLFYNQKPISVWGSGFLHDYNSQKFYRDNLNVCALRGKLTQQKLRKLTGVYYDVPLADGGLLIDLLISERPEKKYNIGLIPHMWHQNEEAVQRMSKMAGVHIIDIKQTPQKVAYEILQCESIVSTSLHGLVFADALHVPNLHVRGNKELRGDNFKFEDYYSSYGLNDHQWILSERIPTYEDIVVNYKVSPEAVEIKKKELIDCFPYKNRG